MLLRSVLHTRATTILLLSTAGLIAGCSTTSSTVGDGTEAAVDQFSRLGMTGWIRRVEAAGGGPSPPSAANS